MAKCFDVTGYVEPCNVVRSKYTGRALLITGFSNEGGLAPTFSTNGLKVTNLFGSVSQSLNVFVSSWNEKGGKALPIITDIQNPFGVTVQGNTDSGRVTYKKTITVSIPATRDCKSEEFIMGLQKGLYGSSVIILESFGLDNTSSINENDIFGAYSPIAIDPTSVTRNEYENGGAWTFNLICEEPLPNVVCSMGGLNTAIDSLNV